jgi:saccharopine dehydrogenase-like NADP-dependent oxidoreductase
VKVALTGAAGIQGMSAMIYLLDQDDVEEIFVSDRHHLDRLEQRIRALDDPRLRLAALDCTDETAAARAFEGYDVVINSAMVRGKFINVTRAALAAGAHYLDMTSLGEEPLQFELHDEFRAKGITALLDMGAAPGLSNIMAVYCMGRLDRTESIDFAWGVIDTTPAEDHTRPLYWGYGFEGIMHLVSGPSIVYEDGEVKYLEPRAWPERFRFKSGEQTIAGMPHREPIMLSESFPDAGIRHIMYRQAFDADSEFKYRFLRDLGFASHAPIDVGNISVAPYDVLWALLERLPPERGEPARYVSEGHCIVRGWKDGAPAEMRLMVRIDPDGEMHRHYTRRGAEGSYRTGICVAIAGVMLGRGQVGKSGVYRPEACVPAEAYIREQRRAGMEVEETFRRLE